MNRGPIRTWSIAIIMLIASHEVRGSMEFFVEPFASDNGEETRFYESLANHPYLSVVDTTEFDDPAVFPVGLQLSHLTLPSSGVKLDFSNNNGTGVPYVFRAANTFVYENAIEYQALVMGPTNGRISVGAESAPVGGIGFWIFDDGSLRDSVYMIEVVDVFDQVDAFILQNDIPRVSGYEVEGFVGVISDAPIVEVLITPLDPATLQPWNDIFEIDTLGVVALIEPDPVDDPDVIPPPEGEIGDDPGENVEPPADEDDFDDEVDEEPSPNVCKHTRERRGRGLGHLRHCDKCKSKDKSSRANCDKNKQNRADKGKNHRSASRNDRGNRSRQCRNRR